MSPYILLPLMALGALALALAIRSRLQKRAAARVRTCTACTTLPRATTKTAPASPLIINPLIANPLIIDDGRDGEKYWRRYYGGRDD